MDASQPGELLPEDPRLTSSGINGTLLATLVGAGLFSIVGGAWLAVGVVKALATGGRLQPPFAGL